MTLRRSITFVFILFSVSLGACYPIAENVDAKTVNGQDEKTFPNGTVIGKYSYTDSEGNPIQVKYYADDQGYGVELNSVKVVKDEQKPSVPAKPAKEEHTKLEPTVESYKYPNYVKKSIARDPVNILKQSPKNHLKNKYKSLDYETYLQNEFPSPKCGSDVDKVKIYNFDKGDDNKKIRNVRNSFRDKELRNDLDTPKFCERY